MYSRKFNPLAVEFSLSTLFIWTGIADVVIYFVYLLNIDISQIELFE